MPGPPEKPAPPSSLEYDRGPSPHIGTRRFRLLLGLTLFNTLMLLGVFVLPHLTPFVREKWTQWQQARAAERERLAIVALEEKCLTHALPPDKVVYEEDPAEAKRLLADTGGAYEPAMQWLDDSVASRMRRRRFDENAAGAPAPPGIQPPVRAVVPQYVKDFDDLANWRGGGGGGGLVSSSDLSEPALVFLGERTTPAGKRYLAEVRMASGFTVGSLQEQSDAGNQRVYHISKNRRLVAKVWKLPLAPDRPEEVEDFTLLLALPDSAERELGRVADAPGDAPGDKKATTEPSSINTGNTLRVFAGQADPADPSRFTIGYRLDGKTGTIDGRMGDDGIVLRPREGAPAGDDAKREARNFGIAADQAWDLTAPAAASKPSAE